MAEEQKPAEAAEAPAPSGPASPILKRIVDGFGDKVLSTHEFRGDATAIVDRTALIDVCKLLRDDPELAFDFLMDVTAVDYIGRVPRFEVVYHFYSLAKNHRVRIKVPVEDGDPKLPSVVSLWPSADWLERETWDMYGIRFEGHPNLKRIYLYEEFEGHPLRKDYPKEKRQPLIGPGAVHKLSENDDLSI